jgi:hypothetical protein
MKETGAADPGELTSEEATEFAQKVDRALRAVFGDVTSRLIDKTDVVDRTSVAVVLGTGMQFVASLHAFDPTTARMLRSGLAAIFAGDARLGGILDWEGARKRRAMRASFLEMTAAATAAHNAEGR